VRTTLQLFRLDTKENYKYIKIIFGNVHRETDRQTCLIRTTWLSTVKKKKKLPGLSPRTNYADRVTAIVGEASANFCGMMVPRGQRDGSLRPYYWSSRQGTLFILPSSSSIVITRLSGPRSRPTISQKIWVRRESNSDLCICSQELRPLDNKGGLVVYCVI
jgi:hypothetical protein